MVARSRTGVRVKATLDGHRFQNDSRSAISNQRYPRQRGVGKVGPQLSRSWAVAQHQRQSAQLSQRAYFDHSSCIIAVKS